VLVPPVDAELKEILARSAAEPGYDLLGLEVMPDHVPIVLSAPPAISPAVIAKVLTGTSARRLFVAFPHLQHKLWGGHLWNPSYYVGTAGRVSAETLQRDIEEQKTDAVVDHQGADPR
jgi:putative transposase